MFLDWLLKTEEDSISYEALRMLVQDRSRWSHRRRQNTVEREMGQRHGLVVKIVATITNK